MTKIIPLIVPSESPPTERVVPKPTRIIKVGQVQLNTSFSGQYYFPLAAGMLQAYAKKHLVHSQDYDFEIPIYKFMPIEQASELLSECDIIGVSNYVWGEQNSLAIARDYKRRKPNGIVVFGGPQVPDSKKQFRSARTTELNAEELKRQRIHYTEDFHRANPFIDIACHGEGERVFARILEQMAIDGCYNKDQIPSASYFDANGNFHYNHKLERMNDAELAKTPSPFTTGVFDKLITAYPDQKWILMYETNRGCPYTCTYCDLGGATEDKVSRFLMEQIYLDFVWAGEHRIPYFFLCDANFGILPRDVQIAEYLAEIKAKYGYPEGVSTQNAKNPKKHTIEALKTLERAGLNKTTVMSQQSLNPATLRAVRRDNMQLDEYYAMQKQLAASGVYTMTDIIIPMPEETYQSILEAISTLITNGQHNHIHFNNLSILRNTEMGNPEYQEKYSMEIVRTKVINGHGKKNASISGVEEYQELVVATNTMPPEDWVRARVLCYMVTLLYFDKLLQIPIMTLHEKHGLPYGQIFETIMKKAKQPQLFPVFAEIYKFFEEMVRGMQRGGEEYIHSLPSHPIYSRHYLDIWWPFDEYMLIELCKKNKLSKFYQEAEELLASCLGPDQFTDILVDAITLNQALIKLPFQKNDLEITLSYNVWELYRAVFLGQIFSVQPGEFHYLIDRSTEHWNSWDEWYEKVVWYGNRRGAYLYGNKNPHQEIAGHH